MKVYQTDMDGVFVGTTTASPDPLVEGNFLIPGGCVETAPPKTTSDQFARWDGKTWVVEDKPLPAEPEDEAEPTPEDLAAELRLDRYYRLLESDWTQLPDVSVSAPAVWTKYRQALRDVPQQPGFPHDVKWPKAPA